MNRRGVIYRLAILALLGGAIALLTLHRDLLQPVRLEAELHHLGKWGPIVFIFSYALATVLFVPGSAFTIIGGALFGPLLGTLCNFCGAMLGAALAFIIARYLAFDLVARKSGQRLERVMRGVEQEGWRFVAFVRLVPLFPFNLLNYALGLTRIPFGTYLLTSAICIIPGAFAYTWLGYAGRQAIGGGQNLVRDGVIALGLLAIITLMPRLVRRFRFDGAAA